MKRTSLLLCIGCAASEPAAQLRCRKAGIAIAATKPDLSSRENQSIWKTKADCLSLDNSLALAPLALAPLEQAFTLIFPAELPFRCVIPTPQHNATQRHKTPLTATETVLRAAISCCLVVVQIGIE